MNAAYQIQKHRSTEAVEPSAQYLVFNLGQETYALVIHSIREIIEFTQVTKIPLTPHYLSGIINLRGNVVPVIDLSARFQKGETDIGKRTCIVIVELTVNDREHLMGLVVDAVNEVLDIDSHQIGDKPLFGMGIQADFIAGMIHQGEKFVILLDINKILTGDEMQQLATIEETESI